MRVTPLLQLLAVSAAFIAAPAFAQHDHNHATPWHQSTVIYDQNGQRVTANYGNYQYVLPPSRQGQGTYYTHNNIRYYHLQQHGRGHVSRPTAVQFGGFSHVDELAAQLESMTNELCLDLHYNYQHNVEFAETYREAYEILEMARYAHDEEHHGDRAEFARVMANIDPLFHHVEEDVESWSRNHRRQIGQLGIIDKMQRIEGLIHHLLYDVGVTPVHHEHGEEQAPPPGGGGVEQAPPPRTLPAPRP